MKLRPELNKLTIYDRMMHWQVVMHLVINYVYAEHRRKSVVIDIDSKQARSLEPHGCLRGRASNVSLSQYLFTWAVD